MNAETFEKRVAYMNMSGLDYSEWERRSRERVPGSRFTGLQWCCLGNDTDSRRATERAGFKRLWEQAADEDEFFQLLMNDRSLCDAQAWAMIQPEYRRLHGHLPSWWNEEFPPAQSALTWAEGGGVLIGCDGCKVHLGFGDDGLFSVSVYDPGSWPNEHMYQLVGIVQGEDVNVYRNDWTGDGDLVALHLEGRFMVYARRNALALLRMAQ